MSAPTTHLRAALLDVDGTLVDSNDAHARAWVDALREIGRDVPFARVRPLIGMGGDKLIPQLAGLDAESDAGRQLSERRGQIFLKRYLPHVRGFACARALLERMKAEGLTLVVATSAKHEEFSQLVRIAGVEGVIDDKTTADDASRSKPDPDVVLAALKKSGCTPDQALMLGDTPYDVQAARSAGVACVAFRSGGWSEPDLGGALAIYDDPADLLAHFDASPFASAIS